MKQGGTSSAPKPADSAPTEAMTSTRRAKSPAKDVEQRTEPRPLAATKAPKRRKVAIGSEKDILVPEWNVGVGENLFGNTGPRVDAVDLLQGIFLPEDHKKLDATSSVESVQALSILMAKVIICSWWYLFFMYLDV